MKKIMTILRTVVLLLITSFGTGCLDNFEEYNRNANEATDDDLKGDNYLVGSKLTALQNLVIPSEEHLYQFQEVLAGDSYGGYAESTVDSWETKFSTFNPSADWLKSPFVDPITKTYPTYRGVIKKTDDEVALALAGVLRVAIMHRLTDAYGPIPYTKIIADKKERLTVPYDTQQEVYMQMFKELDAALLAFDRNRDLSREAYGEYDQVYGGDIKKWIKYTNSLKLRMAMRLTEIDSQTAKTKAAEAIAGGVILDNPDNAKLNTALNRTAMLWNSWQDHAIGGDIISYMNGYKDPRRAKMFTQGTIGSGEMAKKGYYGLRIGITPANKAKAVAACSSMLIMNADPIMWLNASEVAFLKAEYHLRWGSVTDAKSEYERGIRLSFAQYGAIGDSEYLLTVTPPEPYFDPLEKNSMPTAQSRISVKWNDENELPEENLERIITQKWIAIFPLGNEAWAEYRRTGYPRLMPVVDNKSGGAVNSKYGMRRLPYPSEEYSENRVNVDDAVVKLGGADDGGTRVWWDCKTLN